MFGLSSRRVTADCLRRARNDAHTGVYRYTYSYSYSHAGADHHT